MEKQLIKEEITKSISSHLTIVQIEERAFLFNIQTCRGTKGIVEFEPDDVAIGILGTVLIPATARSFKV